MPEIFRSLPWPFEGDEFPPDLGAVVQWTVADGLIPALFVGRDTDGDWLVADGVNDPNVPGACAVMCIWSTLRYDSSMRTLADLPPGWSAERDEPSGERRRLPFDDYD